MTRRILAMLAGLLVVSFLLTACDIVVDDTDDIDTSETTEKVTTEAATTAAKTEKDEETEETKKDDKKDDEKIPSIGTGDDYVCELPELNYSGRKVTILHAKGSGRNDELTVEGATSNSRVSAAVNERNLAVERQLDVRLNVVEMEEPYATAQTLQAAVNAGDATYQIAMNATFASLDSAINGIYRDLGSVEHLDRSKHYWSQGFNEMMTLGQRNRQFLVTGSVSISMLRYTYFTVFSETDFAAHGIDVDAFYRDVKDGKWTIEYQKTLINQNGSVYKDNGNGEKDDKDFYGLVTGSVISVDPYTTAAGVELIVKDESTNALAFNGDAITPLTQLCAAVADLYKNKSTYYYADSMTDNIGSYGATEMFADKRAMMATTCLDGMETHLGKLKEIEYGVVPMPKMTERAEYRTYVHDQLSCLGIARSVTDKNEQSMLGAVMESMAYHSNRIVRSAYYADALGTRVVNDPQARGMLGLLYETATFDFACSSTGVIDTYIRDRLRPLLSTNKMVVSTVGAWRDDVSNSLITINSNMG